MTQNEFLSELEKKLKVVDILQRRLDMATRAVDVVYRKRSASIAELLKLSTEKRYSITYKVNELDTNMTKEGYFYAVEFSKKIDNFVLRLRGIKRNGEPSKVVEPLSEAVAITNIINIKIIN